MDATTIDHPRSNDESKHSHRRPRSAPLSALFVTLVGLALFLAGCSSQGSGSQSSTGGSSSGTHSSADAGLKYGQCMRAHGVANFPEGNANSGAQQTGGPVDIGSPQFLAASNACAHLAHGLKGNAPTPNNPKAQAEALKYAKCMRAHGLPNFPDPNSSGGFTLGQAPTGGSGGSGIDPNSSQFQSAATACRSFMPSGS